MTLLCLFFQFARETKDSNCVDEGRGSDEEYYKHVSKPLEVLDDFSKGRGRLVPSRYLGNLRLRRKDAVRVPPHHAERGVEQAPRPDWEPHRNFLSLRRGCRIRTTVQRLHRLRALSGFARCAALRRRPPSSRADELLASGLDCRVQTNPFHSALPLSRHRLDCRRALHS